jgi:hypothetical protein
MTNRRCNTIHSQTIETIPKWTHITDAFFTGGDIRLQQHSSSQRPPPRRQIISPWIKQADRRSAKGRCKVSRSGRPGDDDLGIGNHGH